MTEFALFLILGLGSGAAYALLANGVILIYKGSGVVNFAQGAFAALAAYSWAALTTAGVDKYLAAIIVTVGAGVVGGALYWTIMRPLRTAPTLAKVVVTLGLLVGVSGLIQALWGTVFYVTPSLFPTSNVALFDDASFGVDRLYLLGFVVLLTTVLWAIYKYTIFGLATRGAAETEKGAAFLGFSPHRIGAANWALGCMLAAVGGILIVPIAGLDSSNLVLLILPALAAALVARFSSFGIATAAAIVIGCAQSELTNYWQLTGIQAAVPFVLVAGAMLATGRLIPLRGSLSQGRPPIALDGRIKPPTMVIVACLLLLFILIANDTYLTALTTSLVFGLILLSLTVITGYVGQISLMAMAFAGIGAFLAARLASDLGVPFPLPILIAAVATVPVGVLLGVPALRIRGLNLAVITLGSAVVFDAMVFQNPTVAGGATGVNVPTPEFAGWSLSSSAHPVRFVAFCALLLGATAFTVSKVRRSAFGRRMLAVRGNERAAAVAGINVPIVKLQAFALSAFVAGIGGATLAYQQGGVTYTQFGPLQSITLLTLIYIGGIGTISGAIVGGLIATGGVAYVALSGISGFASYYTLISGALLVVTVMMQPDGAAVAVRQQMLWLRERAKRWSTSRREGRGDAALGREG